MQMITFVGKSVICPILKMPVVMKGKYVLTDNPDNMHEARFSVGICPVIENSELPAYNQCEEYKYLFCPKHGACALRNDFPPVIDLRNGYTV